MSQARVLGEYVSPSQAARILGRAAQAVIYHERCGHLCSVRVGASGMRLYARGDVERLAEQLRSEEQRGGQS